MLYSLFNQDNKENFEKMKEFMNELESIYNNFEMNFSIVIGL